MVLSSHGRRSFPPCTLFLVATARLPVSLRRPDPIETASISNTLAHHIHTAYPSLIHVAVHGLVSFASVAGSPSSTSLLHHGLAHHSNSGQPLLADNTYKMRPCELLRDPISFNTRPSKHASRRQTQSRAMKNTIVLSILAASVPTAMAQQSCISLQGSSACPAFGAASISTNLTGALYV